MGHSFPLMSCQFGTHWIGTRWKVLDVSAVFAITPESLRHARDAEAMHLDAVLKVNGAKALRLSHVVELLRQSQSTDTQDVELKVRQGEDPHIWLDMSHRITMEPDAKTYCLSVLSPNKIDILSESENLETLLAAAQRVLSHHKVRRAWGSGESGAKAKLWSLTTLVYVWATGFVAGAAGLALLSIYMKKLPF